MNSTGMFAKRDFLRDLQALCEKYKASIGGCGCCGSPWITFSDGTEAENLSVTDRYVCVDFGGKTISIKKDRHCVNVNSKTGGWQAFCKECGTHTEWCDTLDEALKQLEDMPCK